MGTFLLLIITIIACAIFYLNDTRIHRKIMVESTISNHWSDRILVKELNEEIKDKYPNLNMAVKGFLSSRDKFNSDEMSKNVKVLKGVMKKNILNEIQDIINEKDENAAHVAAWYMIACMQINIVKNKRVDNAEKIVKEGKEAKLEDMKNEEVFCFS